MKRWKSRTALLLALLMCFSVFSIRPVAAEEEADFSEPVTFTMSAVSADQGGINADGSEAANYTYLKDMFNVDFDFWNLTWSDYVEVTRTWLNSDSAPDIIMLDVDGSRFAEYREWVDAGRFRPYDLESYPNLKEQFDKMNTGKMFAIDGELYAWPSMTDLDEYNWVRPGGFLYRKDWAEAVGNTNETGQFEFDEWFDLVEKVVNEDPGNNGPGQTIGILTGWAWAFPTHVTGQMSPEYKTFKKTEDGWAWGAALPETLEMVKYTKDLYDRGVIWADQALVKDGDHTNNFAAGKVFANTVYGVLPGTVEELAMAYTDANPDANPEEVIDFAIVRGPNGKFVGFQDPDQWSQTAMNYQLDDVKAERWQHVLSYLVSEDGYNLRNYGIEGVDWQRDESGEITVNWEANEDGVLTFPYGGTWQWGRPGGNNDGFSLRSPAFPEWIQSKVLAAYDTFKDESQTDVVEIYPPFYYYSSQVVTDAMADVEGTGEKFTQLLTSDDIEAEWTAWVESKAETVQVAIDDFNANVE